MKFVKKLFQAKLLSRLSHKVSRLLSSPVLLRKFATIASAATATAAVAAVTIAIATAVTASIAVATGVATATTTD